jgi:hypothetical protein
VKGNQQFSGWKTRSKSTSWKRSRWKGIIKTNVVKIGMKGAD